MKKTILMASLLFGAYYSDVFHAFLFDIESVNAYQTIVWNTKQSF